MNRRSLIKNVPVLAMGAYIGLGQKAAFAASEVGFELKVVVSSNHGHTLNLKLEDLVDLLQKAHLGESNSIDIKGTSSHVHSVSLNKDDLLQLLLGEEVNTRSSKDSGHTHGLQITLSRLS